MIYAGIVKAPVLDTQYVAQHYADLQILEKNEKVSVAFWNSVTQKRKEIECPMVDGWKDHRTLKCSIEVQN